MFMCLSRDLLELNFLESFGLFHGFGHSSKVKFSIRVHQGFARRSKQQNTPKAERKRLHKTSLPGLARLHSLVLY
jgi:hypothetical protein